MTVYVCGLHLSPWRRCVAAWSFSASRPPATAPTTSKKVGWGIPAAFFDACGEDSNQKLLVQEGIHQEGREVTQINLPAIGHRPAISAIFITMYKPLASGSRREPVKPQAESVRAGCQRNFLNPIISKLDEHVVLLLINYVASQVLGMAQS